MRWVIRRKVDVRSDLSNKSNSEKIFVKKVNKIAISKICRWDSILNSRFRHSCISINTQNKIDVRSLVVIMTEGWVIMINYVCMYVRIGEYT